MAKSERSFYVTTPIYYVNDVPHLGTAYTTIAADVLVRYQRLRGRDTFFVTGTDEHGLKIERLAKERGESSERFTERMSQPFRAAWPELSCAYDDFIRTTDPRHESTVAEIWRRVKNNGDLYLGAYEGWYCVSCEAYYTEKELEQGNLCPIHKRPAERIREPTYFFRLSKYQDRLLELYEKNPGFVQPAVRLNEVISFVRGGLEDLSVSRTTFRWGVPVPDDPAHVMYVWFDALFSYFSPTREPAERRRFWPADLHLVGKDILRFHAVYWPAFLWAAGMSDEEIPRRVFAHGFLTFNGLKMSKTLRNTVSPLAVARAFGALRGGERPDPDPLRYYLMRAIAFGQDGDVSMKDMVTRYNSELGNSLGNLLNRTLAQCVRLTANRVPPLAKLEELETSLQEQIAAAAAEAAAAFDSIAPNRALEAIWSAIGAANQYIDRAAPWAHAKRGDTMRVHTILRTTLEALARFSTMIWPVMPATADAVRAQLGIGPAAPAVGADLWPSGKAPLSLEDGGLLGDATPLFPRIDADREAKLMADIGLDRLAEKLAEEQPGAAAVSAAPPARAAAAPAAAASGEGAVSNIAYDDFAKVDLRVGLVVAAERVRGKDKLLSLKVDIGEPEPRPIVAGLALSFAPEQLVGRRVVVVANLEPRKFGGGLVSHGMLLATGASEALTLLTAADSAPPGAKIK